jgi:hypothetical protein
MSIGTQAKRASDNKLLMDRYYGHLHVTKIGNR